MTNYKNGFDASHWNGTIDWQRAKAAGHLDFAFIKLSEGRTYRDPLAQANVTGAKAATDAPIVGYHFARFTDVAGAQEEAEFALKCAKAAGVDGIVLDIEHAADVSKAGVADLTDAADAFMTAVSAELPALLYTYVSFAREYFHKPIAKWPLWIAHYGVDQPTIAPWADWVVWQYDDKGTVDGVGSGDVDLNYAKDAFFEMFAQPEPKVSAPTPKPQGQRNLEEGDRGDDVRALQRQLGVTADGIFGPATRAAVIRAQHSAGIAEDGIVGPKTRAALSRPKVSAKAVVPYPGRTLQVGSRGKDVVRVQRAVGVKADGIYGGKTKAAVYAYQQRHKKCGKPDGIVGEKTWKVMF